MQFTLLVVTPMRRLSVSRSIALPMLLGFAGILTMVGCTDAATEPAVTPTPSGPDNAARLAAATITAQNNALCSVIQPFYWEIGDGTGRLGGASVNKPGNSTTFAAQTPMSIASASKWIYGAYVAERRGGALTAEDIQFLTFRSGYTNFGSCDTDDTVESCVARGTNGTRTLLTVNRFLYGGGHMQKHASLAAPAMNLSAMANTALATEVRRVLGSEIGLSYTQPQLAGGGRSTAADYAIFLRKILNRQLRIGALLGSNATCTNPATCATALGTPIGGDISWGYSIGHWVESDPATGDGAFSSAGGLGFYPWINADKTLYGVLARVAVGSGAGGESAQCGARIRRAWVTGIAL